MTYYFSILARHPQTCNRPAREVRKCIAIDAEDVHAAQFHCVLEYDYLWCDGGDFRVVQISKLHYETMAKDLEIQVEA